MPNSLLAQMHEAQMRVAPDRQKIEIAAMIGRMRSPPGGQPTTPSSILRSDLESDQGGYRTQPKQRQRNIHRETRFAQRTRSSALALPVTGLCLYLSGPSAPD